MHQNKVLSQLINSISKKKYHTAALIPKHSTLSSGEITNLVKIKVKSHILLFWFSNKVQWHWWILVNLKGYVGLDGGLLGKSLVDLIYYTVYHINMQFKRIEAYIGWISSSINYKCITIFFFLMYMLNLTFSIIGIWWLKQRETFRPSFSSFVTQNKWIVDQAWSRLLSECERFIWSPMTQLPEISEACTNNQSKHIRIICGHVICP